MVKMSKNPKNQKNVGKEEQKYENEVGEKFAFFFLYYCLLAFLFEINLTKIG
jgi:hypothetical protein